MSRRSSHEQVPVTDGGEVLAIIREEQVTPTPSSVNIHDDKNVGKLRKSPNCPCQAVIDAEAEKRHVEEKEKLLKNKEIEMEEKFKEKLETEIQYLKDRFGFILQNEQVRASFMLREAHRDRKEKITALQTQLECKNLAGLMYVLCSERKKRKMEMLRVTEEYTNYIHALQDILEESQTLILNLSRGYKTAARVDEEWREKMKKIMQHFQSFVFDFVGGTPETNQYFFDIPALLKTEAPILDNPKEDPCEDEEEFEDWHFPYAKASQIYLQDMKELQYKMDPTEFQKFSKGYFTSRHFQPEKTWYETLDGEDRPFVMYGDMSELKPPQKAEAIRSARAAKTAPKKWKEYLFHEMYLKESCPNADIIKDEFMSRGRWEFTTTDRQTSSRCSDIDRQSRRATAASVDIRGNMGSILKIISAGAPVNGAKTTLLGARDSMEIASSTRLREKHRPSAEHPKVILNVGNKIDAMFNEVKMEEESVEPLPQYKEPRPSQEEEDVRQESLSNLGSIHNDSLQVIQSHVPDLDSKINAEKICPMEKCQRMQVDSFIRSLPAYMRASPFTHFEQNYDDYEACSPEQLDILRSRIEEKKKKEKVEFVTKTDPLQSWMPSVEGMAVSINAKAEGVGEGAPAGSGVAIVGVQTSHESLLPPCTCHTPSPSLASGSMKVYNVADLIPIKQELDKINAECFFDDRIKFERFKVIGLNGSDENMRYERQREISNNRLYDLKKILKKHPSLCEIFQANTRC